MRLDKFIANNSPFSRQEVKRLCRHGLVLVNQIPVLKADYLLAPHAQVVVDGLPIVPIGSQYFMLHKPANVVSATRDNAQRCVLDLLREYQHLPFFANLHLAGRLDKDATGLVLLSDDGKWTQRICAPKNHIEKTYLVHTALPIEQNNIAQFAAGVLLKNQSKPTKSARLVILSSHSARLVITEGKYHQVKRMFAAVGNKVCRLHREAIGNVVLDAQLKAGQYRHLSAQEVAQLGQNAGSGTGFIL